MSYVFAPADFLDVPQVYEIIKKRVSWMSDNGIQQWNTTDYLNVYPPSYFEDHQKHGRLYKMSNMDTDKILGVMVLLDYDARWDGYESSDSYFVHNFATDPVVKGIGSLMLEEAEKLSILNEKKFLRLDCPEHNIFLNDYYETRSYQKVGSCIDGAYRGTLREKKI